ncbi:hypothetical protein WDW89_19550 [Deltaproteobacteria bacterium TL4]
MLLIFIEQVFVACIQLILIVLLALPTTVFVVLGLKWTEKYQKFRKELLRKRKLQIKRFNEQKDPLCF